MIRSFRDQGTEDIFNGINSKEVRRVCPRELWGIAGRKLDQLDSVERLEHLRIQPGNRLEPLVGAQKGRYSIRINERYRICFRWSQLGPSDVEIVNYH